MLAIGSYVWECVARCPANLQIFLKSGGLYSMLDIVEIASYPVRCLYLGALTDMCDCTFCGPCLCTWRGADKKTGLMSLLAIVWREEEDRIGIKRRADGSITGRISRIERSHLDARNSLRRITFELFSIELLKFLTTEKVVQFSLYLKSAQI